MTKENMQKVIDSGEIIIDGLEKDLQAAKYQILNLSETNRELSVKVENLERVIVQKCLEELK